MPFTQNLLYCHIGTHPRGGLLFWLIDGRTRKAGPEKALNGLFPAVAFPQKSESNERRNLKFFKILQMHFEHFGFVDRFEPAKAVLREEGGPRSGGRSLRNIGI